VFPWSNGLGSGGCVRGGGEGGWGDGGGGEVASAGGGGDGNGVGGGGQNPHIFLHFVATSVELEQSASNAEQPVESRLSEQSSTGASKGGGNMS